MDNIQKLLFALQKAIREAAPTESINVKVILWSAKDIEDWLRDIEQVRNQIEIQMKQMEEVEKEIEKCPVKQP